MKNIWLERRIWNPLKDTWWSLISEWVLAINYFCKKGFTIDVWRDSKNASELQRQYLILNTDETREIPCSEIQANY